MLKDCLENDTVLETFLFFEILCSFSKLKKYEDAYHLLNGAPASFTTLLLTPLYPTVKVICINLVEAWYSLEQYIGLKEDKLSSTTVDFIWSEGNLETKRLYWFSKPKMC